MQPKLLTAHQDDPGAWQLQAGIIGWSFQSDSTGGQGPLYLMLQTSSGQVKVDEKVLLFWSSGGLELGGREVHGGSSLKIVFPTHAEAVEFWTELSDACHWNRRYWRDRMWRIVSRKYTMVAAGVVAVGVLIGLMRPKQVSYTGGTGH
jgi:hypothetical protein